MLPDWVKNLTPRFYLFAILVLTVVTGLLVIGGWYIYGGLSTQNARLGMLGLTVLGNLLLVSAYLLSLAETRAQLERAKHVPLFEDVIDDILNPAIESIRANHNDLENTKVQWVNTNSWSGTLEKIYKPRSADYRAVQWMREENPDIIEGMKDHDSRINQIGFTVDAIAKPLSEQCAKFVTDKGYGEDNPNVDIPDLVNLLIFLEVPEKRVDANPKWENRELWANESEELVEMYVFTPRTISPLSRKLLLTSQ